MFCKKLYILCQNWYGLYKEQNVVKGTICSSTDKHSSSGNSQRFFNTHVCMYVCMYVFKHVCMYVCMYACMYLCMYLCIHAFMYVYLCMYIYVNVCTYVFMQRTKRSERHYLLVN